ncbi:hypothetical protein FJ365_04000 [Candidatus Dependentiae bacterium]|nr:hypothetical protein [Candidatus Dependentiae bacterium]
MQIFKVIIFYLLLSTPLLSLPQTSILSAEDLAVASEPTLITFDQNLVNAPADIIFAFADIKYNQGNFKIIECGTGPYSGLREHEIYINNKIHTQIAPYWNIVAHILKRYGIPAWLVGNPPHTNFTYFEHLTGKKYSTFEDLIDHQSLLHPEIHPLAKPRTIAQHTGIVIHRSGSRKPRSREPFKTFKTKYPSFLLLNSNSSYFSSKPATYKLFEDARLHNLIPRYVIYPASYCPTLAQKIMSDLGQVEKLIIKPLNMHRAIGVGVTTPDNLDAHLQHMFGTNAYAPYEEKSIGYWRKHKPTHFIASEFVSSQPFLCNNKKYEPTLRVSFLMMHEKGNIAIHIIGGCWQIPPRAINDRTESLTQCYATDPDRHETDEGGLIALDDLNKIKSLLAPVLAQVYKIILEKSVILD